MGEGEGEETGVGGSSQTDIAYSCSGKYWVDSVWILIRFCVDSKRILKDSMFSGGIWWVGFWGGF